MRLQIVSLLLLFFGLVVLSQTSTSGSYEFFYYINIYNSTSLPSLVSLSCQVVVSETSESGTKVVDEYVVEAGSSIRSFRSGFFTFNVSCANQAHGFSSIPLIISADEVNVIVSLCGDGTCYSVNENSMSCPADCPIPTTGSTGTTGSTASTGSTGTTASTGTTGSTGTSGELVATYSLFLRYANESLVSQTCQVDVYQWPEDTIETSQLIDSFNVTGGRANHSVPFGLYSFQVYCPTTKGVGSTAIYPFFSVEVTYQVNIFVSYCGDRICSPTEIDTCQTDCETGCCNPNFRNCGVDPNCGQLCGLCPYDSFCSSVGQCSNQWSQTQIDIYSSACPSQTSRPCFSGPRVFFSPDLLSKLTPGTELLVHPGFYCGGFSLEVDGLRLTALGNGTVIVPCEPEWWAPSPPECGATMTSAPCWLANNLITVKGNNTVIDGFEFNGAVPNALLNETSVHNISPYGNVLVGAARGVANWEAGENRTKIVHPVLTVLIQNSMFSYLEDSAIDFIEATATIRGNRVSKMGADSLIARRRRQGKTEKDRGSRKEGKKGCGASMGGSSGDVEDNDFSDCDYGGMDGGDYPPSNFPFKKRQEPNQGRQYDYQTTNWRRNTVTNAQFGGLIIEDTQSKNVMVESNVLTTTGDTNTYRGFIVEGVVPNSEFSVVFSDNSVTDIENSVWVWNTNGVEFRSDDYQPGQTGVQIVNCNPFELQNPTAYSNVFSFDVNISNALTGFLLKDEPNDNPLCLKSNRPIIELQALGGVLSNVEVGLKTIGDEVSAVGVSVFTQNVDTKVSREPNSLGQTATYLQVAPDCPTSCNGHGVCAGINICGCEEGYHDFDCSVEICGDNVCSDTENLDNCFSDCDVAVVPPECSNHRGFDESVIDQVLTRTAINKNIQRFDLLIDDLMKVKQNLPQFVETCCSSSAGLDYPLSEVSISQISSSSYAFYTSLVEFNKDNEIFQDILTE